jgi:hypothetical protein
MRGFGQIVCVRMEDRNAVPDLRGRTSPHQDDKASRLTFLKSHQNCAIPIPITPTQLPRSSFPLPPHRTSFF